MAKNVCIKNGTIGVISIGFLILVILSLLGTVYLTKLLFETKKGEDGLYFGKWNETDRNIARLAIVSIWIQFAIIVLGTLYYLA